jgi:hypothetical protein
MKIKMKVSENNIYIIKLWSYGLCDLCLCQGYTLQC